MTHSSPDAPTRSSAQYRWTNRKALTFLDALAEHGKVAAAARSVGMTRQSAYKLRDRVPVIAEGWARAQALGRARRLDLRVTAPPPQGDASLRQRDALGHAR